MGLGVTLGGAGSHWPRVRCQAEGLAAPQHSEAGRLSRTPSMELRRTVEVSVRRSYLKMSSDTLPETWRLKIAVLPALKARSPNWVLWAKVTVSSGGSWGEFVPCCVQWPALPGLRPPHSTTLPPRSPLLLFCTQIPLCCYLERTLMFP